LSSSKAISAVQIWTSQSVAARSHEALDPQVLLERLEEQLDLPALFVDTGDGSCAEVEMVSPHYSRGA
jgi:hypothetical protein